MDPEASPMNPHLPIAALLVLATSACTITAEQAPVGLAQAIVLPTPAVRGWTARDGLHEMGSVVRYQEAIGPRRHLFSVRNVHDQDLGLIDASGRAWRLRPHQEPQLLGTGTVAEGAARILGLPGVSLVECSGSFD
jgi:hypothetical protein